MDRIPQTSKGRFGVSFMKCMLILMNVLYLVISFLMISGATTFKLTFGEHYNEMWYASTIDSLSSLWIATGVLLFAVSIFGIIVAIKESTAMTNIYGLLLLLIFILQMAATITGFTLITQSDGIVGKSINSMMYRSRWFSDKTMDWVQQTFRCCALDGPTDWEDLEQRGTMAYYDAMEYDYYRSTTSYHYWDRTTPNYYWSTAPSTPLYYDLKTAQSCCDRNTASYTYNSNKLDSCYRYFTQGCRVPLQHVVSQSVMILGSSGLIIGILQILGVVMAFTFARAIRRNKSNREVHRWAVHESMGYDRPTYVDDQAPNTIVI